jgi:hypothetical protein
MAEGNGRSSIYDDIGGRRMTGSSGGDMDLEK